MRTLFELSIRINKRDKKKLFNINLRFRNIYSCENDTNCKDYKNYKDYF